MYRPKSLTHRHVQGSNVIPDRHILEGLHVQEVQDPSTEDEQAGHAHDSCYSCELSPMNK